MRGIDVDQIHVGTVIQFVPAELSHSHHGEARLHPLSLPVLVHGDTVLPAQIRIHDLVGRVNEETCQIRQRRRRLRHIRQP